jgi:hypothetical protein
MSFCCLKLRVSPSTVEAEHSLDLSDGGVGDDSLDDSRSILRGDVDDVEDSSGKTSIGKDLGEDEVGAGRELGGLEDADVSGDDGLSAGALGENERSVPGGPTCAAKARSAERLARFEEEGLAENDSVRAAL